MNITIIGASAGVGFEAVKRALQRNHKVTTLSRSEIQMSDENLVKLKGSATNKDDLKKSLENADAVIVALGTGKSMKPTTLYSDFGKLLVELHKESGATIPFIILTGFGAGESGNYHSSFIIKMFFRFFLKDVYADKRKMEETIANSAMKWVIVRPGLLKNKPLTEKYKVESRLFKGMKIGSINRSDVADFLVKQAENPTESGKYPAISNK